MAILICFDKLFKEFLNVASSTDFFLKIYNTLVSFSLNTLNLYDHKLQSQHYSNGSTNTTVICGRCVDNTMHRCSIARFASQICVFQMHILWR